MLVSYLILCAAAFLAGVVNAVAGGGTLLTFPALFAILGPVADAGKIANATSTVALFPGSIASAWGYRREFAGTRVWLWRLIPASFVGGILGAICLVVLSDAIFQVIIPWLILVATLLFLLQPAIAKITGIGQSHRPAGSFTVAGIILFQLVVSIYGGYFGAGIGILMLSSLALMGLSDIHQMNAVKALLASIINGVSVVVFIGSGKVLWHLAVPMIVASTLGGWFGAVVGRKLDKTLVRILIIIVGLTLAVFFFVKNARDATLPASATKVALTSPPLLDQL